MWPGVVAAGPLALVAVVAGWVDVRVQSNRGEFTRGLQPLPYGATIVFDGASAQCAALAFTTGGTACTLACAGTTVACR